MGREHARSQLRDCHWRKMERAGGHIDRHVAEPDQSAFLG
jgi:hypothetical protein